MMLEKKTTEFLEVLSSKEPVPGGGGASAAVGAFAAALGMMVASLTEGKKTYAAVEEEILCAKDRLKEIRDRLVHLADEDARAFEPLSKAYGLPRTTEEEQKVREKVMEEALKEASLVPLTIMETVLESMAELEVLEEKGKQTGCQRCGRGHPVCPGGTGRSVFKCPDQYEDDEGQGNGRDIMSSGRRN